MIDAAYLASAGSRSAEETRRIAAAVASCCLPGDAVLLVGELGAGKTTFAQGFAEGLGVRERVVSPTFTLVRHYSTQSPPIRQLLHADLYRLDDLAEIEDLGLDEMTEEGAVTLVEWGYRAVDVLGPDLLVVELERPPSSLLWTSGCPDAADDQARSLRFSAMGPAWKRRQQQVADAIQEIQP